MTSDNGRPGPPVVTRIAGFGLPGRANAELGRLTGNDFNGVLASCEQHRLLGLLAAAVDDGALIVDDEQHERIEHAFQAWLAHALRVERLLLDTASVFDATTVPLRVLKGAALAHMVYPTPAWRVFGDLDLLVPATRLHEAATILGHALDLDRVEPELRPGFDDRFGKEAMLKGKGRPELDLHRTFVEGGLGLSIHLPDLFQPGQPFTLGEREFQALPAPQLLLHAAFSAVVGDWPPRLGSVRDVAQVLLVQEPDRDTVLAFARRWRAEPLLARALTMAWDLLEPDSVPPLVEWARARCTNRRERWLLGAHLGPGRASSRRLAALAVLPGLSTRMAYLHAVAWPSRAYLERRGLRRRDHVGRALCRLLPHRSPR